MKFRLPLELILLGIGIYLMQLDYLTVIFTEEMMIAGYKTIQLWFIGLPIVLCSLILIVFEIQTIIKERKHD